MTITIDLPQKGSMHKKHMTYDELLQWIATYDSEIVEEFLYIYQLQKALENKEYTTTSSL